MNKCSECHNAHQNDWRRRHPEWTAERAKRYWNRNLSGNRERGRVNQRVMRLAKFGLTLADYDRIMREQESRCAICRVKFEVFGKGPAIDHCHETGAFRGLLCELCNRGLGLFADDPVRLMNAIDYLSRQSDERRRVG